MHEPSKKRAPLFNGSGAPLHGNLFIAPRIIWRNAEVARVVMSAWILFFNSLSMPRA